ncbi:DUF3139 domain-containing protein [Paenisporosarcina indica]|uniref:DUF3139 domain-containing protein n=1 Tax=Paenisporosarcina indica TaxID=650093 RepID=UPI001FEAA07D|nr:DUF3139 domain-containing protein [Paenisporosarcina indica]
MSRLKKIMVTFLVIVLFVVIVTFVKIQDIKNTYEKSVTNYLLHEQGYEKNEIKSVEGIWRFKLPAFYTVVVFEDEPFVQYIYYAHNGVKQIEYSLTYEGIEKGIDETKLKHYVPFDNIDKYKRVE